MYMYNVIKFKLNLLKIYVLNATQTLQLVRFRFMVFNATFNNISVILWRSVLLVKETGGPRENHRFAVSH